MRTSTLAVALLTAALALPASAAHARSRPDQVNEPTTSGSPRATTEQLADHRDRLLVVHMRPHAWEKRVVELTNARRRAHGVKPVTMAPCPRRFAAPWARHLARTHQLVHHIPLNPLFKCVKQPHTAGENIAVGFETPRALVRAWMSDQGHRDNLLNPAFRRIAVVGARVGHGPTYAVQDFVG